MMDDIQLVETIRGHLDGKRYLLVFDDVWRSEACDSLSITLPTGKEGSRIIVTTRSEQVANTSSRNRQFLFRISPLSHELSWKLFCKKVFDAPDYSCPPELENVSKEILQKCDGLPLAILTIAGLLLASKADNRLKKWKDLCDNFRLEIQTNNKLSMIDQILGLSYNDLPIDLKPCFLFLGTFPKDYEIGRKRLMRRWIAEGIVSGVGGFPAEKVAERCFNELVNRSLVQPSEFDDNGTVRSCRVHDMMLDVIISISRKENFAGGSSGLVPNTDLSHLRSFTATAFGEDVPPLKDYRKHRLLRAIDLEGCTGIHHFHRKSFSKLDWIAGKGDFRLEKFPLEEIEALAGATTCCRRRGLVGVQWTAAIAQKEKSFCCLVLRFQKRNSSFVLGGCRKGREEDLFNRRFAKSGVFGYKNFDICTTHYHRQTPKTDLSVWKLKKLRTFGMALADNVQLLQEIGELLDLQKLGICFGDQCWRRLAPSSPPLLLYKLKIHAKLGGLPAWFASLKHVVKITLRNTQLRLKDLQVLRNLHTVVMLVLGIWSFDINGEDLVFDR
ncbi:hypothetical protein ZIOFF_014295 [Zingiber officinale]|uniref:NB-ARC domain-containing protein n=1 Tax=Zingiber officinale TaxID=94328 RepID=A0A8J5LVC8_ZINOF|nr:hypothetical protein ZIOFF_014295 [Zingiber officinale]